VSGFCESGVIDDCNLNLVHDLCDIALGTSLDVNFNLIPDECERENCWCGDLNDDGVVNLGDFSLFANCMNLFSPNQACLATEFLCSDFNVDSRTDLIDFATFALLLGTDPNSNPPDCAN